MSEQYEIVKDLVQKWRSVLELDHYTINISHIQSHPPTLAEVDVNESAKTATIFLSADYFEDTEEQQDRTILHETIHCVTLPPMHTLQRSISHLSQSEQTIIVNIMQHELEKVTEHFESVIYNLAEEVKEMACKKKGKGK